MFAAEGWPACLNPLTTCAADPWFRFTVGAFVLPRLIQWSNTMQPEPSPLIEEVPSLDNGGLTEGPFTVTYHLNPRAVWNDRTPITCDDVAFTWRAILNTTGTYAMAGYSMADGAAGIEKVECPDPTTVKLDFNKIYVDWPDLFGGAAGFIIEKAAFPEIDQEKPDLTAEMQDSIPFSGGPWILASWDPENQAVLTRNDAYWGPKPFIDQVIFVPRTNEDTEVFSLLSGDVDAIFPQRPSLAFAGQFGGTPEASAIGGESSSILSLWFQLDDPVFKDPRIRQAFADALVRDDSGNVVALSDSNGRPNDCGPWVPGHGPWCPAVGPFARYRYDPAQAVSLLEAAGLDCSPVPRGDPCLQRGEPLRATITVPAEIGLDTEALAQLVHDARPAGFEIRIHIVRSSDLYTTIGPTGDFQVALYRLGPFVDPSVTGLFSCNQIPTPANGFGGASWDHLCDRQADRLMQQADQDRDETTRAPHIQQLGALLAEELPMLPLDVPPAAAAWRNDKLTGIDPSAATSPYGFFFGMDRWAVAS